MARRRPPHEPEGNPVLSEAERRVAVLAASGDANREIAKKLYITVSTYQRPGSGARGAPAGMTPPLQ
jgi:DNA-binding CsgD family transcriptional regulator